MTKFAATPNSQLPSVDVGHENNPAAKAFTSSPRKVGTLQSFLSFLFSPFRFLYISYLTGGFDEAGTIQRVQFAEGLPDSSSIVAKTSTY